MGIIESNDLSEPISASSNQSLYDYLLQIIVPWTEAHGPNETHRHDDEIICCIPKHWVDPNADEESVGKEGHNRGSENNGVHRRKKMRTQGQSRSTQYLYFKVNVVSFQFQNEKSIMLIFREVTSQVDIQKLRSINYYKNHLLSSVTHEFRTPINSIMGHAQVAELKLEEGDHDLSEEFASIRLNTKLLSILFNDVVDYCELNDKEEIEVDVEEFDLSDFFKEVKGLYSPMANHKGLELIIT